MTMATRPFPLVFVYNEQKRNIRKFLRLYNLIYSTLDSALVDISRIIKLDANYDSYVVENEYSGQFKSHNFYLQGSLNLQYLNIRGFQRILNRNFQSIEYRNYACCHSHIC